MKKSVTDQLVDEINPRAGTKKTKNTKGKGGKPTMKNTSHIKDIVIAVLITGIVGVLAGMYLQSKISKNVELRATRIVEQNAVVSREQSKK